MRVRVRARVEAIVVVYGGYRGKEGNNARVALDTDGFVINQRNVAAEVKPD